MRDGRVTFRLEDGRMLDLIQSGLSAPSAIPAEPEYALEFTPIRPPAVEIAPESHCGTASQGVSGNCCSSVMMLDALDNWWKTSGYCRVRQ